MSVQPVPVEGYPVCLPKNEWDALLGWRNAAEHPAEHPARQLAIGLILECIQLGNSTLELHDLGLTSLPPLGCLDRVTTLACFGNNITGLSSPLPPNLATLDARNNRISSLPFPKDLPASLRILRLSQNLFRNLPPIPDHVTQLDVSYNLFKVWPGKEVDQRIICITEPLEGTDYPDR